MLGQQTGSDESGEQSRGQTGNRELLGRGLPFAVAFAAGFLLGSRRGDGELPDAGTGTTGAGGESTGDRGEIVGTGNRDEEGRLETIASEIRSRAMPGGSADADAGGATDQPSSMGSVAGEAEREREREGDGEAEVSGAEDVESEEAGRAESDGEETERDETEGEGAGSGETEREGTTEPEAGEDELEIPDEVEALEASTAHGMPTFGLGTYQMEEYDACVESVRTALELGYRHVDTAQGYHNEEAVGDAIAESEVAREDLFVATKVDSDDLDYDHVLTTAEESLERLGMDSVDLLYVHWPTGEYEAVDTLEAFAELRQEGLIEEIGVSNFTVDLLEEAIEVSEEPIFANQVEMHPLLPQEDLQEFCAQDDVDVELVAYAPIARGDVDDVDALQEVADKHDATPAQVSLAWLREKGVTAIPKATGEDHLRENWLSLGVELDDEDVEKIDDIDERRRLVDPDQAPWNQ